MSQENNNILKNCQLMFVMVSVIFLGFAVFNALSAYQFSNNAKSVYATITKVTREENTLGPHIEISYRMNDTNYQKILYSCNSNWYEGKKIAILCNPNNPKEVRVQEMLYFQSSLFGFLGTIFIIITIILVTYQQQLQSKQRKLIIEGNRVDATIIGCVVNTKIKIYGRHPYQIEATYEDLFSKQVYHFESHNIYHDPPNMLGMHVSVYVNPNNHKDYYMDLVNLRKQLLEKGTEGETNAS